MSGSPGIGAREGAGWALLALLTLAILLLALFRPTDPGAVLDEIRLAAGFDRYQAAMNEGRRMYVSAVASLRGEGLPEGEESDEEDRAAAYRLLAEAVRHFQLAREEAEGFHEEQRAQIAMSKAYYVWAQDLYHQGRGRWYVPGDEDDAALRRADELVERGLALPDIRGSDRVALERLDEEIDRALSPWPLP